MLGTMPRPADTDPERNHSEWHSAGGEIKVRPRIFERTLQILRTSVALKMVSCISIFRRSSFDVPQNPDSDMFLQKGPTACYTVARAIFMPT